MQSLYGGRQEAFFDENHFGMSMWFIFFFFFIVPRPQRKNWMSEICIRILKCCPIVFLEAQFNVENICLPLSALWIIWLFEKSCFSLVSVAGLGSVWSGGTCQPREKIISKKKKKPILCTYQNTFPLGMGVSRSWHILRQSTPKHSWWYSRPNVTKIIIDTN